MEVKKTEKASLENKRLLFVEIGFVIALAMLLYIWNVKQWRLVLQLCLGLYMLVYLGFFCGENLQIEGFWYYILTGGFEAGAIHFGVSRIYGPLFFGRAWCGYACPTAMILDLLPYKVPQQPRKKFGWIRYITFAVSFAVAMGLFLAKVGNVERLMFWAFLISNIIYYAAGIILAVVLKDNRAFCKYLCPATVFMKPISYFCVLKVHCIKSRCTDCGKCMAVCPMDVEITNNGRGRENATDCILCGECVHACPEKACRISL